MKIIANLLYLLRDSKRIRKCNKLLHLKSTLPSTITVVLNEFIKKYIYL